MPPELEAALQSAGPDPLGNRWARAWRSGRTYLAVLNADGRLVIETKWREYGHRYGSRLTEAPAGLPWRPLKVRGPWPGL
jgi:hypothetical protein